MDMRLLFVYIILAAIACQSDRDQNIRKSESIPFESQKWKIKEGGDYPFREKMLQAVLYTDTIRNLTKEKILDQMGSPDRAQDEYLYYTIEQQRIGAFPLHTSTIVIKLTPSDSVDWIKLHE